MASILVVGDEPDIRYLTQVNLELDGHRVMTASNGPERGLRLQAQTGALSELARIEKGIPEESTAPRPRLSRLEHVRRRPEGTSLTVKQVDTLRALVAAPSVSAAAIGLGVSRSNVYASLRRVARKLRSGLIMFEV
jgi:CheY-like chemotaxis protein